MCVRDSYQSGHKSCHHNGEMIRYGHVSGNGERGVAAAAEEVGDIGVEKALVIRGGGGSGSSGEEEFSSAGTGS